MKCTHKKYNPKCLICLEITAVCGYGLKSGDFDIDGDFEKDKKVWNSMVEYYNNPPKDDEIDDNQFIEDDRNEAQAREEQAESHELSHYTEE